MKKMLTFLSCLITLVASSQTERGDWLVGGNMSFNTAENSSTFRLSPNAAFFAWRNVALGGRLSYDYDKLGDSKLSSFALGPLARVYMGGEVIKPFSQMDINFLSNKTTTNQSSTTESGRSFFVGLGLALFINRNVALEGLMGYQNTRVENKSSDGGLAARFGFQVYISRLSRLIEPKIDTTR
jgi:hypothetical protein